MLLVCTLALTTLSMASIALIRSTQQQIRLVDAQRSTARGRQMADGLYQRAIATLRNDPTAQGIILDPTITTPGARAQLVRLTAETTQIQVFLFQDAVVPAISRVVEPDNLSN